MPLDEALSRVVVDLSGRPGLEFHVAFTRAWIGQFDVDLQSMEFFRGVVNHALISLHVDNLRGNSATIRQKPCSRALAGRCDAAVELEPARPVPSPRPGELLMGGVAAGTVAVVDYGMGNLRSVAKALEHVVGGKPVVVMADDSRAGRSRTGGGAGPGRDARRHARTAERGLRQAVKPRRQVFRHLHRPADALRSFRRAIARPRHPARAGAPLSAEQMHAADGQKLKVPHMAGTKCASSPCRPVAPAVERHRGQGAFLFRAIATYVAPDDPGCISGITGTACPLPAPVRGIISSPFNAIRRRVRKRVCASWPISSTGILNAICRPLRPALVLPVISATLRSC